MAIYSSIHPWRIPWTEEPGRLQSMGSQRVGHDWATFTILRWRTLREKQSFFFLGEQKKSCLGDDKCEVFFKRKTTTTTTTKLKFQTYC